MKPIQTTVEWSNEGRPWLVTLTWDVIEGRWECVGLAISTPAATLPVPLHAVDLRALKLGALMAESRPKLLEEAKSYAEGLKKAPPDLYLSAFGTQWKLSKKDTQQVLQTARERLASATPPEGSPGRPRLYSPEHYAEVVQVYVEAYAAGDHPTRAVAEHFHISRSAAGKQIARCRALGLLGPTEKRKAGGLPPVSGQQTRKTERRMNE